MLLDFPIEIQHEIIILLAQVDLLALRQTCKHFQQLLDEKYLVIVARPWGLYVAQEDIEAIQESLRSHHAHLYGLDFTYSREIDWELFANIPEIK